MLKGRLGLETARIPQADRHGLLWLGRGKLSVEDGCLRFATVGVGDLRAGVYSIPFQKVTNVVLGPGTTISHDALRLLSRHQTGLLAVGEDGVRFYASMPFGPDDSARARRQVSIWADPEQRINLAVEMYRRRMGKRLKGRDLNTLRGIEGARMKAVYEKLAAKHGIAWSGRRYDRQNPDETNTINQAINHAATAIQGAAMIAVSVTGTIPQLGFIHESSGKAFALDIADLYRASVTLPVAFASAAEHKQAPHKEIERITRYNAGSRMRDEKLVSKMIDAIKELLDGHDDRDDAKSP